LLDVMVASPIDREGHDMFANIASLFPLADRMIRKP
jgi:hypothetical protein